MLWTQASDISVNTQILTRGRTLFLVLVGLCVFLSACCSPGVKPEDANLFQASCGIASGDFDKQLEDDRKQAASSRQVLEDEKSKSQTL